MSFGEGDLHVIVAQLKTENARLKQLLGAMPGIVRCRDCEHFAYADSKHGNNDWCAKHEHIAWSVNGYCAWGVRKDDGDD